MSIKPSHPEEEYFAKRESELRDARRRAAETAARDAERKTHFMKCPKCGADLTIEDYHGIEVDRCLDCHGIWFDSGEAKLLLDKEKAGFGRIFSAVVQGVRGKIAK